MISAEATRFGLPTRLSRRARPRNLSAVLLTDRLTAESARWFSEVSKLADELVILIDAGRAEEQTRRYARAISTRVIDTRGKGYVEAHLEEMVQACRGEWVLRLDSDERLSGDWIAGRWRQILQS